MISHLYAKRLLALALILQTFNAQAWLRMQHEDAEIVERSELIVVARIKSDSMTYVPHNKNPNAGGTFEHHAILVISGVLKGECKEKEIPVVIYYGLTVTIGGQSLRKGTLAVTAVRIPPDRIDLYDYGGAYGLILTDLEKDQLWFLRKRAGVYGRDPGTGDYGIVDPEDVQSLKLKEYLLCYMAGEPEKAVREIVAGHPELVRRAQRWFDHLEVARISKIEDVNERARRLVPYFLKWQYWPPIGCEAEDELVKCGDVGARLLLGPYNDPVFLIKRKDIIQVWGRMNNKDAVLLLINLLAKHDEFWSQQKLEPNWWNSSVDSKLTVLRHRIYGEVYNAVNALGGIDDRRAKDIIELTRERWEKIGFSNPQIIESCDRALKKWK